MVIDKLARKLTDKWTGPETSKDQWEIYNYGLQIILTYTTIIILIGFMSIGFRHFWLTMLYLLGFLVQRLISGGYHAKDDVRCIGLTMIVCLSFNLWVSYFPAERINGSNMVLFVVSASVIWLLAPIDYVDRFGSEKEYVKHKKRGRYLILFFAVIVLIGFGAATYQWVANALLWGYFTAAMSILAGYTTMKGGENEYEKQRN